MIDWNKPLKKPGTDAPYALAEYPTGLTLRDAIIHALVDAKGLKNSEMLRAYFLAKRILKLEDNLEIDDGDKHLIMECASLVYAQPGPIGLIYDELLND